MLSCHVDHMSTSGGQFILLVTTSDALCIRFARHWPGQGSNPPPITSCPASPLLAVPAGPMVAVATLACFCQDNTCCCGREAAAAAALCRETVQRQQKKTTSLWAGCRKRLIGHVCCFAYMVVCLMQCFDQWVVGRLSLRFKHRKRLGDSTTCLGFYLPLSNPDNTSILSVRTSMQGQQRSAVCHATHIRRPHNLLLLTHHSCQTFCQASHEH